MNIPKDKNFPEDSVQCHNCGGLGCEDCDDRGWFTPSTHPKGRTCHREICDTPIPPDQVAIYCTNKCAYEDV